MPNTTTDPFAALDAAVAHVLELNRPSADAASTDAAAVRRATDKATAELVGAATAAQVEVWALSEAILSARAQQQ